MSLPLPQPQPSVPKHSHKARSSSCPPSKKRAGYVGARTEEDIGYIMGTDTVTRTRSGRVQFEGDYKLDNSKQKIEKQSVLLSKAESLMAELRGNIDRLEKENANLKKQRTWAESSSGVADMKLQLREAKREVKLKDEEINTVLECSNEEIKCVEGFMEELENNQRQDYKITDS